MIEFVGSVILLLVLGWFLKIIIESIIWNIKDIFGPVVNVVNAIVTSIKK